MAESVRTFWKGHLRLALVTIPVRLVSAEKAQATPRFHQIDRKSKQRIRYIKSVAGKGETPKAVAKEDIVMGYEVEPGNYVLMEPDELDAVKLETRHTIELTQFVEMCEIDPLYFDRPYYILPDGDVAEEGYVVIRDALKAAKKAAIGQLTLRGKENLVALYPGGDGLVLDTLRYDEEVKDADDIFRDLGKTKSRADMLKMAEELIKSRAAPFDPGQYKNHYAEALRDLVKQKLASGGSIPVEDDKEPGGGKVIDFMEALKRSLKGSEAPAPKAASASRAKPKTAAAKKTAAKSRPKPAAKRKRA